MTQKTEVQDLKQRLMEEAMLPSFSADGVSRLQTFTLRSETMATGWENTLHGLQLLPYT